MGSRNYPNKTVADLKQMELGQNGSVFVKTGNNVALSGHVFVAITFLQASVFESGSTGLVPETTYMYPSSTEGATLIVSGSEEVDSYEFPAGTTIYGRWTAFELNSGACIAYIE